MDDLLGRAVDTLLPVRSVDAAIAHARVADDRQAAQHLFGVAWPGRESAVDVTVHASGELVVIEAEPDGHGPLEPAQVLEDSSRELAVGGGLAELADSAARAVARLTGYDRVMVYRFAADGSGSVIAEALSGRQVPYLGLRYPASDIPAQARELYLRNPTRLIADARHEGLPIVSLEPAPIERFEALEQLRALWHGHRIVVGVTPHAPEAGVDTPADLERVRAMFDADGIRRPT